MYIEFYINAENKTLLEIEQLNYKQIIDKVYFKHFHKESEYCEEKWLGLNDDGHKCYMLAFPVSIIEYWFNVPVFANDFYKDMNNNKFPFIKEICSKIPISNIKLADREREWGDYYGEYSEDYEEGEINEI